MFWGNVCFFGANLLILTFDLDEFRIVDLFSFFTLKKENVSIVMFAPAAQVMQFALQTVMVCSFAAK